ncbi:MAG: hypothetical protein LUF29_04005 [Oscillospiraceae bacterium]|nr:hypothetical protein [Oscillospiraceae bacterium]
MKFKDFERMTFDEMNLPERVFEKCMSCPKPFFVEDGEGGQIVIMRADLLQKMEDEEELFRHKALNLLYDTLSDAEKGKSLDDKYERFMELAKEFE